MEHSTGGWPSSRLMKEGSLHGAQSRDDATCPCVKAKQGEQAICIRGAAMVNRPWWHARGTCQKNKYMRDGGSQVPVCEIRHNKGKTKMISVMLISSWRYGFEYTVYLGIHSIHRWWFPNLLIPKSTNSQVPYIKWHYLVSCPYSWFWIMDSTNFISHPWGWFNLKKGAPRYGGPTVYTET